MRAMLHGPARSRPTPVSLLTALVLFGALSALPTAASAQTTTPVNQPVTVQANQVNLSLPFTVYNDAATTGIQATFTCTTSGAINSCVPPSSMELPDDGSGTPMPTTVYVRFNSSAGGSGTLVLNVTTTGDGGGGCCQQRPARIPGTPPGPSASTSDGMSIVMSLGMSMGTGSGSYLVTVAAQPTYTVAVSPDGTPVSVEAGTTNTQIFTVTDNGNTGATYTLSCTNSWGTSCSAPDSVSVGPNGDTAQVAVQYQAGAAQTTGTITLTASYSGVSDAGSVSVTAQTFAVAVTPPDDTLRLPAKQPSWTRGFSVDNIGTGSASYTVSATCPGSATICNLSVAQNPLPVAAGQSGGVSVAFGTGPEPDTGRVHVVASDAQHPAVQAEGWFTWISRAMCGGSYSSFAPCDTTIVVTPGTEGQVSFTLRNTGEIGQIGYALSCPGASPATLASCQTLLSYIPIDQGQSSAVLLAYTAGSTQGEAEIRLLAQSGPGGEQQSALPWQTPASVGPVLGGPWSAAEAGGVSVGALSDTSDEQLGTSLHLQILAPTSVVVTTPLPLVHIDVGAPGTHTFIVRNQGPFQATYGLASVCTGMKNPCTLAVGQPKQVTLDPGDSTLATVNYTGGASGDTATVGLKATHTLNALITQTGTATVVTNGYRVAVRTTAQAITVPPVRPGSGRFTIYNQTDGATTYLLTASCTGPAFTGPCSPSADSVIIGPHDSAAATLAYTTTDTVGSPGTLFLLAVSRWAPAIRDSAFVDVTVGSASAPGITIDGVTAPVAQQERGPCLTIRLTASAAYECADLRVVHALPALRTYNTTRAPVLVYNSQAAHPHPLLAANVTLDSTLGTPDSVIATLAVEGVTRATSRWNGASFASGATKRIVLGFDASSDSSFTKPITLSVLSKFLSAGTTNTLSADYALAVLNRDSSRFGRGWTLAGVERLHFTSLHGGAELWWEGGDGSTRYYVPVQGAEGTRWSSPALDRPDTIAYDSATHTYTRYADHGARVIFDAAGYHVETVNRLGHTTHLYYGSDSFGVRLDSIVVPAPDGVQSAYWFYYDPATGLIDSLTAPGPVATGPRRNVSFHVNGRRELDVITDPDTEAVHFTYAANVPGVIESIMERGGTTTSFTFDAGQKLTGASTDMGPEKPPIVTALTPQATRGLLDPVSPDSAYALVNGPRRDTTVTTLWLDMYGEPVRVRDALGYETTYQRGDSRWPTSVTRVRYADGRVVSAAYDARGNLSSTTDSSTYRDTLDTRQYATTSYLWDGTYDFVTQVTLPEGEITQFGINPGTGNRDWQEDGRGAASRVTFLYNEAGTGQGLLRAIERPGGATDSVAYDALGNLAQTWTPLDAWTKYQNDDIGRVILVQQQIAGDTTQDESTEYDLMDRVTHSVTSGPAMNGVGAQSAEVRTDYDPAGHATRVRRWASGSTAGSIGTIETRWHYDAAGRQIAEIAPDQTPSDSTDNPVDSTVYDAAGNAVKVYTRRSDPSGNRYVLNMTYDALNRLVQRIVPPASYDPEVKGTPTLPGVPDISGLEYGDLTVPGDTARYWYDRMGRLDSASNADAKVRRRYYVNGLLWLDSLRIRTYSGADFDTHKYGLENHYDLDGRRTELLHPAQLARQGSTVLGSTTYGYDPQTGLLERVTDPLSNQFTYNYNARNELDSLNLPWGAKEQYTYDLDGHLQTQVLGDLRSTTYAYDARGKLVHSVNTAGLRDEVTARYSGLGHLVYHNYSATGANQKGDPVNVSAESQFGYDALGNRFAEDSRSTDKTSTGWTTDSITSLPTTHVLSYESGTGRLAGDSVHYEVNHVDYARADSVEYDAAGNTTLRYMKGRWPVDDDPNFTLSTAEDRASYYTADGRLWGADYRIVAGTGGSLAEGAAWRRVVERYRYDPLGRRVLVLTLRTCYFQLTWDTCAIGTIRRTVWDGERELWEIQMPGDSAASAHATAYAAWTENDTTLVTDRTDSTQFGFQDRNPYFGRVLYTYGPALDRPLAVARFQYADRPGGMTYSGAWPVFTIVPHWNGRGEADLGSVTNVPAPYNGTGNYCRTINNQQHCLDPWWYRGEFAYQREAPTGRIGWFGTLTESKEDGAHTLYRRNRYYDPASGRFTQEDPTGLAGGLNLYGYAAGDPVNFSDPFGLKQCPPECGDVFTMVGQMLRPVQLPLEIAGVVVTAPLTISGEGATVTLGLAGKGAQAAGKTATFFRGVSAAEAADVAAQGGKLRAGAAAAGNEGKYLTNTIEAAAKWAAQNGSGSQVLSVTVPADATRAFTSLGRIDGIGQAWWAPMEALKDANVAVLKDLFTPIPK